MSAGTTRSAMRGIPDHRLLPADGEGRPVLEVDRVTKIYPGEPLVTAVHEVSFTVAQGEYAGVPQAQRRARALDALGLVGLDERPHARPTQLSGGQRQRVAIARALVGSPAVVLADEPTGNLDQATGQAILGLLEELHELGVTIVVITHDRDIAARMGRRIEMLDGRIVYDSARPTPPAPIPAPGDTSHGQDHRP